MGLIKLKINSLGRCTLSNMHYYISVAVAEQELLNQIYVTEKNIKLEVIFWNWQHLRNFDKLVISGHSLQQFVI